MAPPALIEELAALDSDEQKDFLAAANAGEAWESAYQHVREKYRSRFLDIISRHQDAPIFRVPFPAQHPQEIGRATPSS